MRRCEQVAANRAVERPTVPAAPEADGYIFDDRLRGGERLDVAVSERRQRASVEAEERLERLLVAASDPVDPLPILRHEGQGAPLTGTTGSFLLAPARQPEGGGDDAPYAAPAEGRPIAVSGRRLARTGTRYSWPAEHEPGACEQRV